MIKNWSTAIAIFMLGGATFAKAADQNDTFLEVIKRCDYKSYSSLVAQSVESISQKKINIDQEDRKILEDSKNLIERRKRSRQSNPISRIFNNDLNRSIIEDDEANIKDRKEINNLDRSIMELEAGNLISKMKIFESSCLGQSNAPNK